MLNKTDLKLILVSPDIEVFNAWNHYFTDLENVEIVFGVFEDIKNFDCIVSPANSFGLMDGGIDAAITNFFGAQLMYNVQKRILEEFCGEQPVGTSIIVETKHPEFPYLAHTPTMRAPMDIKHTDNVYLAMWAMLLSVYRFNSQTQHIKTIVCPGLGTGTGHVHPMEAARQMALAYLHFVNPPKNLNWDFATKRQLSIRYGGDFGFDIPYGTIFEIDKKNC